MITRDKTGKLLPTGVPDRFLEAYIQAALFSTLDDSGFTLDKLGLKLAEQTRDKMLNDCSIFLARCEALGLDPFPSDYLGSPAIMSGWDFWFTRNRDGTGYWDKGLKNGRQLTAVAHGMGEAHLYVGDADGGQGDDDETDALIWHYPS